MGTVYNRGTKHKPKWWVGYKEASEEWTYAPSGQPTKEQARRYVERIEANIAAGRVGIERPGKAESCDALFNDWSKSITNRNAKDDRYRLENHLRPAFGGLTPRALTMAAILAWLDAQRKGEAPRKVRPTKPTPPPSDRKRPGPRPKPREPKPVRVKPARLSDASIRHNLNLLSRFLGWCVEHGHAQHNPVRDIPQGKRPRQAAKTDTPWLDDDATVVALMRALPEPIGLMFYLANRAGLRTGEVAGLRMADLAYLAEGTIRVRYSYDGPLKEDKHSAGKTKWVPSPDDAEAILAAHVKQRAADKAKPEDFVFPCAGRDGSYYRKEFIETRWAVAAKACNVDLTWYEATRHSFVSRNLTRGATLDEVSGAVGHSSPGVTRRYYDHFIRKTFSPTLRAGLPAGPKQ
jgi:integrase